MKWGCGKQFEVDERILNMDQLRRKGWGIPNRCYMCKEEEGTGHCCWFLCLRASLFGLLVANTRRLVHGPGSNPTTDNTVNLPGVGCCGAVNTLRFGSPMESPKSLAMEALSHCFPHLFGMAAQRNLTVEEMRDQRVISPLWRKIHLWRQGRSGQVKEAYRLLTKSNDTDFPSRSIWVARVPTKVAFFAWEATWGKVLTLDRLQRRGV
ncbi:hypothetical protein AAG906_021563 [Vitis piasezkii]